MSVFSSHNYWIRYEVNNLINMYVYHQLAAKKSSLVFQNTHPLTVRLDQASMDLV